MRQPPRQPPRQQPKAARRAAPRAAPKGGKAVPKGAKAAPKAGKAVPKGAKANPKAATAAKAATRQRQNAQHAREAQRAQQRARQATRGRPGARGGAARPGRVRPGGARGWRSWWATHEMDRRSREARASAGGRVGGSYGGGSRSMSTSKIVTVFTLLLLAAFTGSIAMGAKSVFAAVVAFVFFGAALAVATAARANYHFRFQPAETEPPLESVADFRIDDLITIDDDVSPGDVNSLDELNRSLDSQGRQEPIRVESVVAIPEPAEPVKPVEPEKAPPSHPPAPREESDPIAVAESVAAAGTTAQTAESSASQHIEAAPPAPVETAAEAPRPDEPSAEEVVVTARSEPAEPPADSPPSLVISLGPGPSNHPVSDRTQILEVAPASEPTADSPDDVEPSPVEKAEAESEDATETPDDLDEDLELLMQPLVPESEAPETDSEPAAAKPVETAGTVETAETVQPVGGAELVAPPGTALSLLAAETPGQDLLAAYSASDAKLPPEAVRDVATTLIVSDLHRSLMFYTELLGLVEIDRARDAVLLEAGFGRVLLWRRDDAPEAGDPVMHLTFEVGDIHAAYESLRAKGVVFTHEPRSALSGEVHDLRAASFLDPDGHGLAITELREH